MLIQLPLHKNMCIPVQLTFMCTVGFLAIFELKFQNLAGKQLPFCLGRFPARPALLPPHPSDRHSDAAQLICYIVRCSTQVSAVSDQKLLFK